MTDTIGIDISKDHLDAHRLSDEKCAQFANTKAGLKTLNKWIGCTSHRVVYEATGRYHREMEACLSQAGFALVKVNPRRARQFANAIGKDAKTDRIDAAMLARMGSVLELKGQPLKTENMHDLSELHVARRGLIKDQTACRNRLAGVRHKLVKSQLKARLGHVEKQITQVDAELKRLIHKDESLKRSFTILTAQLYNFDVNPRHWRRCCNIGSHRDAGDRNHDVEPGWCTRWSCSCHARIRKLERPVTY